MARPPEQQRRRGRGGGRGTLSRWLAAKGKSKGNAGGRDADKKGKVASIKNRIRSVERLLRKDLPEAVKATQERKLEELRKLAEEHARLELERAMALRYRKIKFFERRKIERRIRRVEKQQRALADAGAGEDPMGQQAAQLARQMAALKEDLEYVRFFPKTERYVALFMGNDDPSVVAKRQELRARIKENLAAAAAAGNDLEETGSEDDGAQDLSADEFFLGASSSDDADADDELGDDTSREQVPPPSPGATATSSPSRQVAANPQQLGHARGVNGRPSGRAPWQPSRDAGRGQLVGRRTQQTGPQAAATSEKGRAARALMPPPRARSAAVNGGGVSRQGPGRGRGGEQAASAADPEAAQGKSKRKRKHAKKTRPKE